MDAKNSFTSRMKTPRDPIAYIALGSNLGSREENICTALARLRKTPGIDLHRISDNLENPAVGGPLKSPSFLNAVAEIHTSLQPVDLLHRLIEIENGMGRARFQKWEPRIIDLDLILYGNQVIQCDELTVPHPLMHQRRFVLEPLAQLCPDFIHPIFQTTISTLLNVLSK